MVKYQKFKINMNFFLLYLIFGCNSKNLELDTRDIKSISSGKYKMEVKRKEYYFGHSNEDYDIIRDLKPIDNGFNLMFRCRQSEISISVDINTVVVNIVRKSSHFIKKSKFTITVHGGNLYDIFSEEMTRNGHVYTILALRVKND